ncbi:MAG: NAD-dependent epimerase/dehydratase family protein [Deltaproteobacteria bacterium]|nr:NAD-dependent epimerase/dehydratase family protein [Deltaproteobacteria bacterium]
MNRALVLGGTRYFGKRLVQGLLAEGVHVTVVSRGNVPNPFGTRVTHVSADREDRVALGAALAGAGEWGVVFDNICYSSSDAAGACEIFQGRTGRYVHTSTQSIYESDGRQTEGCFDPCHHPITLGTRADFDYGEAKRQAEAVFFQRAKFPVTAVRIPIVAGPDDYTGRLNFHIDRVKSGKTLVIPNLNAQTSFISSDEAARFLRWTAGQSFTGPVNACADGTITIGQVISLIEAATGKTANIAASGREEDHSPFVGGQSRFLDNTKARELGFEFSTLESWLPNLIKQQNA